MWYVWLIAAGIFFVVEIATIGFLVFWLGVAALLAMITSFITSNVLIQTIVFVISSCILIPFTKPLVDKFVNKPSTPTNAFSLINKHCVVIATINPTDGTGQVKVNGEIWSAKCEEDIIIEEGTEVEVLKIDGVKLLVSPTRMTSTI